MTNRMRLWRTCALAPLAAAGAVCALTTAARAAEAANAEPVALEELVVTAQKREQSLNTVGMSITAATGATLARRGVTDTADLERVVPGFVFAQSPYTTPVYTLRGVGLYESGLSSSPAVTVYVDEAPLPYPVMQSGALLDLERVEVLKGPQGTLFGQNSTGGAINYIAAKPTKDAQVGAQLTVSRFDKVEATGFVSGPLTDTLRGRVALRTVQGGAWQRSVSRPGDQLGDSDFLQGRVLLDWTPSDRVSVALNLNAWRDRSDPEVAQLQRVQLTYPFFVGPNYGPFNSVPPAFLTQTPAGANARDADWTKGFPSQDDQFQQATARVTWDISDAVRLTSITAYERMKVRLNADMDAGPFVNLDDKVFGSLKTVSQEVRLSGDTPRLTWIAGANYDHTDVDDRVLFTTQAISILPTNARPLSITTQTIESWAIFGNGEYRLTDRLTVLAGARYTNTDRHAANCNVDVGVGNPIGLLFGPAYGLVTTPPGGCIQLDRAPPVGGLYPATFGPFVQDLPEDNVSWRGGLNYTTESRALYYATVSKGYKAGVISNVSSSTATQQLPVKQEELLAYEVGVKTPILGRAHLNLAGFYYDYTDKQIRGRRLDPVFGLLELLVNVPKSEIYGAEAELTASPVQGLDLSLAATYLHSEITQWVDPALRIRSQAGTLADFTGSPLPYTPQIQVVGDAQYQWPIGQNLMANVGAGLTYHSADNATFHTAAIPAADYRLRPYALLDLRAGIAAADGNWSVSVFGRNVTDVYYWNTVFQGIDELHRYAGRPATYGVTLSVRR